MSIKSLRLYFSVLLFGAVVAFPVSASLIVFNSLSVSNNDATRNNWLTSIGESTSDHLIDFESGYASGQNVSGATFSGGLVITDNSQGQLIVETGLGSIGGSNPVGNYSISHNEQPNIEFDFSVNPIDYFALLEIDTGGTNFVFEFVDSTTSNFYSDGTEGGGDSAEFIGFFSSGGPLIQKVYAIPLAPTGQGYEWGIDNIEYGLSSSSVPEPTTSILFSTGLIFFLKRRLTRRK